jgi:chemotaxis protein MotB
VSRRALSSAGVDPDKFVQIVGKADTDPLSLEDPYQPQNRRISIVLKREVSVLPPELRKDR